VYREATALLYVTVIRNIRTPSFNAGSTTKSVAIPEDEPLNTVIETLSATDLDRFPPNNQINCRFQSGSAGQTFFGIKAAPNNECQVYVMNDLRTGTANNYAVSHIIMKFCI